MRKVLLTHATTDYQPLIDLCEPARQEWCSRFGWTRKHHILHYTPPLVPGNCWQRPQVWLQELQQCDWLFFMGADTLITNRTIDPQQFMTDDVDFVIAQDGAGIQSDVWFMRNCPVCIDMLKWCYEQGPRCCLHEQDALNAYLTNTQNGPAFWKLMGHRVLWHGIPLPDDQAREIAEFATRSPVRTRIVPQRALNAYHPRARTNIPPLGNSAWRPGDFVVHLAGATLEYRLKFFQEMLNETRSETRMTGFPTFEDWKKNVLNPDDTKWWRFDTDEWYQYYLNKFLICRAFKPTSILEIGVRFGYSAFSFIQAAPSANYMGIDADDPKFGGWTEPTMAWAQEMLRRNFPVREGTCSWCRTNTQAPDFQILAPKEHFDFIHVDGDHSYDGARNDLVHCLPFASRVILVDDYLECPGVQAAVDEFSQKYNLVLLTQYSARGEAVLLV